MVSYFGQPCVFKVNKIVPANKSCDFALSSLVRTDTPPSIGDLSIRSDASPGSTSGQSVISSLSQSFSDLGVSLDDSSISIQDAVENVENTSTECAYQREAITSPVTPNKSHSIKNDNFRTPQIDRGKFSIPEKSKEFYLVTDDTDITIIDLNKRDSAVSKKNEITFASVGGLDAQIKTIREMIDLPIQHPELFSSYGKMFTIYYIT